MTYTRFFIFLFFGTIFVVSGAWISTHIIEAGEILEKFNLLRARVADAFSTKATFVNSASVSLAFSQPSFSAPVLDKVEPVNLSEIVDTLNVANVVNKVETNSSPSNSSTESETSSAQSYFTPEVVAQPVAPLPAPVYSFTPTIGSLGGGGGGVTNPSRDIAVSDEAQVNTQPDPIVEQSQPIEVLEEVSAPADLLPPQPPTIDSPVNNSIFVAPSVYFSGTAEALSKISSSISSTTVSADLNGAWGLSLILPEGASAIMFFAEDSAGNISSSTSLSVAVDSRAPDATVSIAECSDSLSESSCLVGSTALSISWSSSFSDVNYFVLDLNGIVSTTTSLSAQKTGFDRAFYTASVSAVDIAGNYSATSTVTARIETLPVVINEVAWAGTNASAWDEWIELKNNTSVPISLSNWTLYASDLSPYIPLSGIVPADGYFLIEKKNTGKNNEATESPVANVTADLWADFGTGLNNNGESLILARRSVSNATTTFDSVATCSGGGTIWCGGSSSGFITLERYDPMAIGTNASNWSSHIGEFILNGRDVAGNAIVGTPKARNSINYLISLGSVLSSDKTLFASSSPYLIGRSGLSVANNATLTIQEGVVVKVVSLNSPSIIINGKLVANGSASNPVVFTAFADDAYGGDMNADGSASFPSGGAWRQIWFKPTSIGSSMSHTKVLFGGNAQSSAPQGAIGVDGTSISFSNVTVATSSKNGIALLNSNSSISNSYFSGNNSASSFASGVYASGGAPSISNSFFSNNYFGLFLDSSPASVSGNSFVNNTVQAVNSNGVIGVFNNNSGIGNLQNAIVIGNETIITQAGATTTLFTNSLPYLVKRKAIVVGNSTLAFENGVVVKGHDNRSSQAGEIEVRSGGRLYSSGTAPSDLIFTSIRDSSVGGITELGIGNATAGDWIGITIKSGGALYLSGFTLSYGGQRATNSYFGENAGALTITGSQNSSGVISKSLFSANYQSGLNLQSVVGLSVSDSSFVGHLLGQAGYSTAIFGINASSTFSNISFGNNQYDGVGRGSNILICSSCGSPVTSPANLFSH